MSGFWEHKLLSPSLWALGLQERRRSIGQRASLGADANDEADGADGASGPRPPRRMADSYCEVRLPFRTEPKLAEDYTSIYGGIRLGKLLEDLDVLAASIAYLHCDDLDLTIVTAAVDRIDLLLPIDTTPIAAADLRMRGSVTYVGRSSIEVTLSVEIEKPHEGGLKVDGVSTTPSTWELAALAKFILVARNPSGGSGVEVNRLLLETDRELEIFARGAERHAYRLRRSQRSLFRQPPEAEEVRLVHELCMPSSDTSAKSSGILAVLMDKANATSLRICHPQERNIHNFIFGGHLCREAFELAYALSLIFLGGRRPGLRSVDDIAFVHPVPIGSLLDFSAQVMHSRVHEGEIYLCVQVQADVIRPDFAEGVASGDSQNAGRRLTTNTFHFTLSHPVESFADAIPAVQPRTYVEAMLYLEGKRRLDFDLMHSITTQEGTDDVDGNAKPPHYDPTVDA